MQMPEESSIQLAKSEDLNAILEIMDKANQYVFDKTGEYSWTAIGHAQNEIRTHLSQGNCYVMKDKRGAINALVTLNEEDTYSWDEEGTDHQALYFHKLMKDPKNSPARSGLVLLSFAAHEAIRRNKKFLRGDSKLNVELIKYYESLGLKQKRFTHYKVTGNKAVLLEAEPTEVLKVTSLNRE